MKNRFVKNLFQVLSSLGGLDVLALIVLLEVIFEISLQNREKILFCLVVIACLVFLNFGIGFYWVFQKVLIDETGISVYLFGKTLRHVPWASIEAVKRDSVMRNLCFVISVWNEERPLNLDYRKSIKRAMLFYAPKNIVEILDKIP